MREALGSRLRLVAAAALFSTAGAAIKACHLSSWQVAAFRAAVAVVAVLVLMPDARRRFSRRAALVALAYASTSILFTNANKLTTAASAILLQSSSPLYIVVLGRLLLGERERRGDWLFMGAIAGGLALFFVGIDAPRATAPDPLLGNVLALLCGIASALVVVGLRWLARRETGTAGAAIVLGNVTCFLVCLPLALPVQGSATDWAIVLYLGVFQLGLAYVLFATALTHVPALQASLLGFLEPVLSPAWALLVHGERPGPWSLLGGGVILLATAVRTLVDVRGTGRIPAP